jgi:hypothetical protein
LPVMSAIGSKPSLSSTPNRSSTGIAWSYGCSGSFNRETGAVRPPWLPNGPSIQERKTRARPGMPGILSEPQNAGLVARRSLVLSQLPLPSASCLLHPSWKSCDYALQVATTRYSLADEVGSKHTSPFGLGEGSLQERFPLLGQGLDCELEQHVFHFPLLWSHPLSKPPLVKGAGLCLLAPVLVLPSLLMPKNVVSAFAEDDLGPLRQVFLVLLKEVGGKANDAPAAQNRSGERRTSTSKRRYRHSPATFLATPRRTRVSPPATG